MTTAVAPLSDYCGEPPEARIGVKLTEPVPAAVASSNSTSRCRCELKMQLVRLERRHEAITLLQCERRFSQRHFRWCISRQVGSHHKLPVYACTVCRGRGSLKSGVLAELGSLPPPIMPLVLCRDLSVQVSWLNASCQLPSAIQRFRSGLLCHIGSKMPAT